jgi:two-component system heavy metal sensor histidine kinase CusS
VQRAVSNLLSNAIRHAPEGEEVRLWTVRDDSGTAIVNVSNPGSGIPREHLGRIFERFYRIDSSRGVSHEGWGSGSRSYGQSWCCTVAARASRACRTG